MGLQPLQQGNRATHTTAARAQTQHPFMKSPRVEESKTPETRSSAPQRSDKAETSDSAETSENGQNENKDR